MTLKISSTSLSKKRGLALLDNIIGGRLKKGVKPKQLLNILEKKQNLHQKDGFPSFEKAHP